MTLDNACPKPVKAPKKPRRGLPPSSSRPPRTAPPKARNPKRKASEFARTYHSKARVAFVKSLPCVGCVATFHFPNPAHKHESHNAHTTGGGMGRKGDYATIVPLCPRCHSGYDEHRYPFDRPFVRDFIADQCEPTERAWLAFSGGAENEEET